MNDLPEEAVEAAHKCFWAAKTLRIDSEHNMELALNAAAPAIRKQERERLATELRKLAALIPIPAPSALEEGKADGLEQAANFLEEAEQ